MTNGRLVLAALLAIALLVGVGIAVTSKLSDEQPAVAINQRAAPPRPATAAFDAAHSSVTGPEASLRGVAATEPPPGSTGGAVPRQSSAAKRAALRSVRRDLIGGLRELHQQAARCGAQGASFVLVVEAAADAIRVESARVDEGGPASGGALACAQSALTGQVIPTRNVVVGRRWEIPFAVSPQ